MRFTVLFSSLLLAGVMSAGVSIAPAATTVRGSDSTVATPAMVPVCPPKQCY